MARAAGYDAVVLVNHHFGGASTPCCGSGAFPADEPVPTVCTTHEAYHALFEGDLDGSSYPDGPALGALGGKVSSTALFNGWGDVHLFDAEPEEGELVSLDTYAVPEAMDPDYASGFGDLSVHEVATSLQRNDLAYYSYYAAGMRVTKIEDGQLVEVGHYVDERGSDFWGVEAFVGADGKEYFAGSDRNFGLQIFQYTGTE